MFWSRTRSRIRCPAKRPACRIVREIWSFEDPAATAGTATEKFAVFRRVRDQIEQKVEEFVAQQAPPQKHS